MALHILIKYPYSDDFVLPQRTVARLSKLSCSPLIFFHDFSFTHFSPHVHDRIVSAAPFG